MRIETEESQLLNRIKQLDNLVCWQQYKAKKAYKLYKIKKDWAFSFWIFKDTEQLKFEHQKEIDIENNLNDYKSILRQKLTKLDREKNNNY